MAPEHKLVYLPEAEMDIINIVRFHAERAGPKSAREIYQTMREALIQLQNFHLLGQVHPDPELALAGYRKLVLNHTYVAVYKMIDNAVTVYRIVNGAMDYPKLLK